MGGREGPVPPGGPGAVRWRLFRAVFWLNGSHDPVVGQLGRIRAIAPTFPPPDLDTEKSYEELAVGSTRRLEAAVVVGRRPFARLHR
jgi:hypothetical protein